MFIPMAHAQLRSARLLDQLRERLRYAHYSLRTEKTYVYWARFFIRFHRLRHPKEMGAPEVQAFLSFLANDRRVAPSTHRQALAAILYLYKEVLTIQLPWLDEIGRPKQRIHIPVVLSRSEVAALLQALDERHRLICQLLYGAGLRPDHHRAPRQRRQGSRRDATRNPNGVTASTTVAFALGMGSRPSMPDPRCLDARCARTQVSACRRKLGMALGLPIANALHGSTQQDSAQAPSIRATGGPRHRPCRTESADTEEGHCAYTATLIRDALARLGRRHSSSAGIARPQRCEHDHDLHARSELFGRGHS